MPGIDQKRTSLYVCYLDPVELTQIPVATAATPSIKVTPIVSRRSTAASVAAATGLTVIVFATRVGVV